MFCSLFCFGWWSVLQIKIEFGALLLIHCEAILKTKDVTDTILWQGHHDRVMQVN